MERIILEKDHSLLIGYHTQESRETPVLENPMKCKSRKAWLGIGYYFFTELEFAKFWGEDFKKTSTGFYDVYEAHLNIDHCLNAVFSEEGYFFFRARIEEAIDYFKERNKKVTLEQVHRFLADNIWKGIGIDGILYDDIPRNPKDSDRIHSEIPDLYYKKRIQVVLFSLANISKFGLLLERQE